MEFRTATNADFDKIYSGYRDVVEEFEKRSFDDKFHKNMLTKSIKEKRNIVCEVNGEIVGFVEYDINCPNLPTLRERSCWVEWVWVSSKHRGEGIGRALYEHLFKELKKKKFEKLALDVMAINLQSQKFHERVGFEEMMKIYVKKL